MNPGLCVRALRYANAILRSVGLRRLPFLFALPAKTDQVSHDLVARFDVIAIEDLHVGAMTRSAAGTVEHPGSNVAAKRDLNRSVLDAGRAQLRRQLSYKAAANILHRAESTRQPSAALSHP